MNDMSAEERDSVELEIYRQIKSVRLVFELGFPIDLVAQAQAVVSSAGATLVRSDRIRYPASFVLYITSLAKDRRGRTFWSSPEVSPLCRQISRLPQQLAELTLNAIKRLGLETFDDLIEEENALRNMTPVTMHSGIPVHNVADLVYLIDVAARRLRYSPEEQIQYWSATPHGFAGLWAAPRRLLQGGTAIAVDLLEQFNEALRNPNAPEVSGLPRHLVEAINTVELVRNRQIGFGTHRVRSVPSAFIELDELSSTGPILRLPRVDTQQIKRWRLVGAIDVDVKADAHDETLLRLVPSKDYEISAIGDGGTVIQSKFFRSYRDLPVLFFSSKNGQLLERQPTGIQYDSHEVVVLTHPKVDLDGVKEDDARQVISGGSWDGWKIWRIQLGKDQKVTAFDTVHSKVKETISFIRMTMRPTLIHIRPNELSLSSPRGEVFVEHPMLQIDTGGADKSIVDVRVINEDEVESSTKLSELASSDDLYSLSELFNGDGEYRISVDGPLGLRMPEKRIVLLQGLQCTQDPPLGLPGQSVTISLNLPELTTEFAISPDAAEGLAIIAGIELTVRPLRIVWSISIGNRTPSRMANSPFSFTTNEVINPSDLNLFVRTGFPCTLEIEMNDGFSLVHSEKFFVPNRRVLNLGEFIKYATDFGSETHTLVARVGASQKFTLGKITSDYIVSLNTTVFRSDDGVETVGVAFEENKKFSNRVIRAWSLDRPWEPSWSSAVPDDIDEYFTFVMPKHLPPGRHRLWMKIEGQHAQIPRLPRAGTVGVVDIVVEDGAALDLANPIDRIVSGLLSSDLRGIQVDDIKEHGHVLLGLLSLNIWDKGRPGLSDKLGADVYELLESDLENLIKHIVTALDQDVIIEDFLVQITLAIMPLLFEAEDKHDLSVESEFAELVWSRLPIVAAIAEPWKDSADIYARWQHKLGWPKVEELPDVIDEVEEELIEECLTLESSMTPDTRDVLAKEFEADVRRVCHLPRSQVEFILGSLIGSRADEPLSVDGEWDAVAKSLLSAVSAQSEVGAWRNLHNKTLTRSHHYVAKYEFRHLVQQYEVKSIWMDDPQYKWILLDIVALAISAVDDREKCDAQMHALLDAMNFAPAWVEYSLLLALSMRPFYSEIDIDDRSIKSEITLAE